MLLVHTNVQAPTTYVHSINECLTCIWMTIIDSQFYIIDSLALDISLESNANLVVAWL